MKDLSGKVFNKAEEILLNDKVKSPSMVAGLVSSEIYYVLSQFFEIQRNSFSSNIHAEADGVLNISFNFKANRVLIKKQPNQFE